MRVFSLFLLAMLFSWPAVSRGASVVVTLPTNVPLGGCTLRVYSWTPGQDWPKVVGEQTVKEPRVNLELNDGEYSVEVGGVRGDSVVLLRSGRFAAPQHSRVELKATRTRCRAQVEKADAGFVALSLRRLGNGVEKWTRSEQSAGTRPDLIVSPGESYNVSAVCESKTAVLAIWKEMKPEKSPWSLTFSDTEATYDVSADIAVGTPPLQAAAVRFVFPETTITLDDAHKGRRLRTNRDRALVSYNLLTRAGESFRFTEQAMRFDQQPKVAIGGDLTANLFAAAMHREDGGKWAAFLVRRIYLSDPSGRWVDLKNSSFGFACEVSHGQTVLPAKASDEVPMKTDGFKSSEVTARVAYRYGGRLVEDRPRGTGFVEVKTKRVRLSTPPALLGRARRYARMVEVIADIDKALCGRPGPKSWRVDWRLNGNNAKSIVAGPRGGGNNIWGSYPFHTLERFVDPFVEPDFSGDGNGFVAHELLHTFGYNHGDEMSRLEWAAEDAYRRLRWKVADTGIWPVWEE